MADNLGLPVILHLLSMWYGIFYDVPGVALYGAAEGGAHRYHADSDRHSGYSGAA